MLVMVFIEHYFMECTQYVWESSKIARLSKASDGIPDSKVHGANMGPIWGRQDPGGPHVGPINFAIWDALHS